MKRFLLPASALVLVVTACGAGAKPAPRVTLAGAHVPRVSVVAARRKEDASREARLLLREFVPPPGARATREPRGYGGVLRRYGSAPLGEIVDVHRFWSVRKPLAAVAAFVRTHRPPGLRDSGATYGSNVPHYLMWSFSSPSRYLDVTAVALRGRTVLRVDALALWIYPRSPSERIPPATRTIVVRGPKIRRTVTNHGAGRADQPLVRRPPGVAARDRHRVRVGAPPEYHPLLPQRRRHSTRARDRAGAHAPSICDPIGFKIGGKTKKPLIDRAFGPSFAQRLEHLLGVRLEQPLR